MQYRLGFYQHVQEGILYEIEQKYFSEEEYDNFRNQTQVIWDFKPVYFSWDILIRNFKRFDSVTKAKSKKVSIPPRLYIASEEALHDIVEVSQEIIGFLATASTFLIIIQRSMKKHFGENSTKYNEWNEYRKSLFNDSIPYQISYELRNYSQHYMLPFTDNEIGFENGEITDVGVYIDVNQLLSSGYDWKKFASTLKKIDGRLDVYNLIKEYYECLDKIFVKMSYLLNEDLMICKCFFDRLYNDKGFPSDAFPVIFKGENEGGKIVQKEDEYIPTYLLSYFQNITKN